MLLEKILYAAFCNFHESVTRNHPVDPTQIFVRVLLQGSMQSRENGHLRRVYEK